MHDELHQTAHVPVRHHSLHNLKSMGVSANERQHAACHGHLIDPQLAGAPLPLRLKKTFTAAFQHINLRCQAVWPQQLEPAALGCALHFTTETWFHVLLWRVLRNRWSLKAAAAYEQLACVICDRMPLTLRARASCGSSQKQERLTITRNACAAKKPGWVSRNYNQQITYPRGTGPSIRLFCRHNWAGYVVFVCHTCLDHGIACNFIDSCSRHCQFVHDEWHAMETRQGPGQDTASVFERRYPRSAFA